VGDWRPIVVPILGVLRDFGEANAWFGGGASSLGFVPFHFARSSLAAAAEGPEARGRGGTDAKSRYHCCGADRVLVVRSVNSSREVRLPQVRVDLR
jgi:hypothetical protein